MQRPEVELVADGASDTLQRTSLLDESMLRQWWTSHVSQTLQPVQNFLVPVTLAGGLPAGAVARLDGTDLQAVSSPGLVSAVPVHFAGIDSPSGAALRGAIERDPLQVANLHGAAIFAAANASALQGISPAPIQHAASTGASPAARVFGLPPDRAQPLGLSLPDSAYTHSLLGGGGRPGDEELVRQLALRGPLALALPPGCSQPAVGAALAGLRVEALQSLAGRLGAGAVPGLRAPEDAAGEESPQSWFVMAVNEGRRAERGFRLVEVVGAVRLDNACVGVEWRSAQLSAVTFDVQTFVRPQAFPAPLELPHGGWVPVRTIQGKLRGDAPDAHFAMIEQEQEMVAQLYDGGGSHQRPVPHRAHDEGSSRAGMHRTAAAGGDGGQAAERRPREHDDEEAGARRSFKGGEAGRKRGRDKDAGWRCEVCNIIFSSSQALGGHRINSTDHKQNLARLRRQQGDAAAVAVATEARHSKDVVAHPQDDDEAKAARSRLPSMAQMPGFLRVLRAFPVEVGTDICVSQSPTAYFSSCRLELFKRHSTFGELGTLIIDKYFTECWSVFEELMQDPKQLPELRQVGFDIDTVSEEQLQDLKVFLRMLRTKKKSLDINRRAVSKRIKGIRTEDGTRKPKGEDSTRKPKGEQASPTPKAPAQEQAAAPSDRRDQCLEPPPNPPTDGS